MKFLHLSDLHIGKRVCELSMIPEQKYVLNQVIGIIDSEKIEAVIIAGDIYDKSVPPVEAVQVFDDFLSELSARELPVFVISGNHDSAERVAFGSRIMSSGNIYISPVFGGKTEPVRISDEHGDIFIYMMPFIKPMLVKRFYPDVDIETSDDAIKAIVGGMDVDESERNILVAHQFVTGATLSNSEEYAIGGIDSVGADAFDIFDYTALGHVHRPQNVRGGKVRYSGSLLKYKPEEAEQEKSVTIVEIGEKGNLSVRAVPIKPEHELKTYEGTFDHFVDKSFYSSIKTDDYIFITLTDEKDVPDAHRTLGQIYTNLLGLSYNNSRTRKKAEINSIDTTSENISPCDVFAELYGLQYNREMTEEQRRFIEELVREVWEEEIL